MPKYKSVNSEWRYYPTLGVEVNPGDTVNLPDLVDAAGLELVDSKVSASKPTTTAPVVVEEAQSAPESDEVK